MANKEDLTELAGHMLTFLRSNTEFAYILQETPTSECFDKYTLRIYSGHSCIAIIACYGLNDLIRTLALEINRYGLS